MGRTLVIGDMHGAYRALLQCLERSNFDKENDLLITMGDISDGWSETPECIDELLTIKNRIDIRGNHDHWLLQFLTTGVPPVYWLSQGGQIIRDRYLKISETDRSKVIAHREFLEKQHYCYLDDKNRLFLHGGFNWHVDLKKQNQQDFMWDRHAFYTACYWELEQLRNPVAIKKGFKFNEVYVGHTCTNYKLERTVGNTIEPLQVCNMWNIDQGAGWDGKLSIMDINTKHFWQSDIVTELYPDEKGKRG